MPGVDAAGVVSGRPFDGIGPATGMADPTRPLPADVEPPVTDVRWADAGYFAAMRIPVVAGALFDRVGGPPRVVINQTAAHTLWPSERAVGRRASIQLDGGIVAEVIGVVADVHLADARTPPRPTAYLAADRGPAEAFDVVVRGAISPDALVAALRRAVTELDPAVPVHRVSTMDEVVQRSMARDRFTTVLLGAFAVTALLLAAVGIYGVFSGDVTRRQREIGIRCALGARSLELLLLVLRRGMTRALAGVAIGLVAALLLTRLMTALLFGVGPADPIAFAAVAAILLGVAALATLIPAIRASRTSPMTVLRNE